MNKKLLLLCSTLLLSVAAFAQWEKPVPTSREELKVSVVNEDTTIFYLYNKDADAFFVDGNSWATQASIGTIGIPVWFTQNEDGSYLFHDWSRRENKWLLLFIDSESSMFVDRNAQENYFWDIVDMGDKVYRFHGADANPLYNFTSYPNCYMGYYFSDANESTALNAHLDVTEELDGEAYYVDWWLISEADYKAMEPKLLAYDAAKALEPVIEEGEDFMEINLDDIKAVYNNTNSTAAELDSVRAALTAAIDFVQYIWEIESEWPEVDVKAGKDLLKSGKFSEADVKAAREKIFNDVRSYEVAIILAGATEDTPADATTLMENASFEKQNISGWQITAGIGQNLGYQYSAGNLSTFEVNGESVLGYINGESWISGFIESWHASNNLGNGTISQTIKGLPAGKYSFECDAIACRQSAGKQESVGVYLFAEGGGVSAKKSISTDNEKPEHFKLDFVSGGGDITLGLMTQNSTANWMAADNFVLWFYGEIEDDPYKVILNGKIADYERQYPDIDDVAANQEIKDDYSATLAEAKDCTEGFIEMDSLLATKVEALTKSVEDYKRLESMLDDLLARAEAFEDNNDFPELFGKLADYHMKLLEYYDDRTADEALIDSVQATISKIIVDEITENLRPGVELTPLIFNPAFDTNFDSWSTTGARPGFGGKGGQGPNDLGDVKTITESGCAEVYHAAFDMFQIVRNMPKGSFKLTAQAFERYDGVSDGAHPNFVEYWEQNPVKSNDLGHNAVLYANTYEKKLPNILAYATPEPLYTRYQYNEDGTIKINDDGTEAKEWYSDSDQSAVTNGGFVPNSMDGANFHFTSSPDAYLAEVNFSVKEDGDSILVGLKIATNRSWVIFDNFRLFYNGNDASSYKDAIDKLMAELNAVFTGDNVVMYGKDAEAKVNAAKEALNAAVASNDGDVCAAALDQGYEALEYAKTSINDYNALDEAYSNLGASIEEYSETAPASTLAKANELFDSIEKALSAQDKTNAEVEYMIERAKYYAAAFLVPDTQGASVDNPIDLTEMIVNADFETDDDHVSEGWSGSGFGRGGDKANSAERYSMGFNTYQDLAGLPAGYYVAYVQAFYRHGNSTDDYAKFTGEQESTKEAYFYAKSSVENAEMPIAFCSAGAVPSGTEWVSGATSAVGSGYVNPNTMQAFAAWCNQFSDEVTPLDKYTNGAIYYNHVLPVQVGEDGKLRIGVKKDGNIGSDWFICDNFRLYYIGTEGPDPAIDSAIKGVEIDNTTAAAKGIYNLAGQKLAAPVKGFNIINGQKYFVK
ncbi:MAG: hypothetical protein K5899_02835 [Bacteroidaceae bacterium]|nr:hypothetical protein [Bacteroidaceae bacterium]